MALINPTVILDTAGYGLTGWSFAVLGARNETTGVYAKRAQGENPVFTTDQQGVVFIANVLYLFIMQHPDYCQVERGVPVTFDDDGKPIYGSLAEIPETPLTTGTDLPITLTDATDGDVLTTQTSPETGYVQVVNAKLYSLFPDLRYGLGLGVTIETVNTFDPAEFDPADFDTGGL